MEKYYILEYSESAHCCFKASIMERENKEAICECFDLIEARYICDLLNAAEDGF